MSAWYSVAPVGNWFSQACRQSSSFTPQGSMHGSFFCITEDAHWFESPVAEFALADTATLH